MFSRSYQQLPQRDSNLQRSSGLSTDFRYNKGISFDYIPNVTANDFTGEYLAKTDI